MIGTIGRWLIPLLLAEMHERTPRSSVVVVDATTTSLVPQLAAGTLDLAVVNLPVADPDVESSRCSRRTTCLVVPDGHPLAGRKRVTLADLAGHPLLLEPPGTGFRDDLDADADRGRRRARAPQAEVDGMRLLAVAGLPGLRRRGPPRERRRPADATDPRLEGHRARRAHAPRRRPGHAPARPALGGRTRPPDRSCRTCSPARRAVPERIALHRRMTAGDDAVVRRHGGRRGR